MHAIVKRDFPRLLMGSLLLACTACSLTLVEYGECDANEDCRATFGNGWSCATNGLCVAPLDPDEIGECDVAVCDRVINIGNVSAQTGPTAINLGIPMVAGVRAALKEANDEGGVNGRQLNLVVRDDGYETERAGPAALELIEGGENRKAIALVGNVGTPPASAIIPLAVEHDVIVHGSFTGAGILREDPPARVVFNYRASYKQETAAMVFWATEFRDVSQQVPPQNVGVLAQGEVTSADNPADADPYGKSGYDGVVGALNMIVPAGDVPVATYERNTEMTEVASSYFLQWLAGPTSVVSSDGVVRAMIVMVPTAAPASKFIIDMRKAIAAAREGQSPQGVTLSEEEIAKLATVELLISSVSFVGTDQLVENLLQQGAQYCLDVVIGQVVPLPLGDSSGAIRYREALAAWADEAETPTAPGFVTFEGYLAGRLFIDALKVTESLDTDGLVVAFESLRGLEYGIGTQLGYSVDDHQASDRVFGTQLTPTCEVETLEFDAGT